MTKIRFQNLLFFLLLTFRLGAQAVTVDGHVYFGPDAPAPGIEVGFIDASNPNGGSLGQTITDDVGYFSEDFIQSSSLNIIEVVVLDLCTDFPLSQTVDLAADFTTVDFHICSDIDPPIDSLCAASFSYQQLDAEADAYVIEFVDLSYSHEPITSWQWDFGDGEGSTEQNPSHVYADQGLYDVLLTISSEECSSTTIYQVEVRDGAWCNCPEYWDPVCVTTPTMDTIVFDNICFAECEGYTIDDVFHCFSDSTCVCPDIWDPVCVLNADGSTIEFGNFCFAECEGYTEADLVDCESDCNCPDIWDPVCVQVPNSSEILTFGNECLALCEGFSPDSFVGCVPDSTCICPDIWDPVCVIAPDGSIQEFSNFCYAECEGFTVEDLVNCDNDCNCFTVWDPVCVATDNGFVLTFSNICEAECEGFSAEDVVDCIDPCICPDVWDPVCVMTEDSIRLTFGNPCEAECAGFTLDDIVPCAPDCECPDVWDPVCIATPGNPAGGGYITFSNACEAECAGFTPDMFEVCDSTGCVCPEYYSPVCVVSPDGTIITFDNQCFAECAGYYDYFSCDEPTDNCVASFRTEAFEDPANNLPNTFQFTDESWVLEGEITSWNWDFGDGSTSTEQNPIHNYQEDGVYIVTLIINSSTGCSSIFENHICVGDGGFIDDYDCQAMFFFEQEDGLNYDFNDFSFGTPTSWTWDFGDGHESDVQNPSHTYENSGVYIVSLTVATEDCESSASMILVAGENVDYENNCFALFMPIFADDNPFFEDSLGLEGVLFLNLSNADGSDVLWDFGDETTSTEYMPFHVYTANGAYEVTLTITNEDGCTSTYTGVVNITDNEFLGSPEYSLTTATEKVETAIQKVTAYPNPTTNEVSLKFTLPQAGEYTLQVMDINGKLLITETENGNEGVNINTMNFGSLTNGMYFIQITSGQASITTKVIKN